MRKPSPTEIYEALRDLIAWAENAAIAIDREYGGGARFLFELENREAGLGLTEEIIVARSVLSRIKT